MKNLIKNIFTSIVVIDLLFSSFSFDVYKHVCTAHNFNAASILGIPECEQVHSGSAVVDDCCKTEVEEIAESDCCQPGPIEEANPVSLSSMDVKCCFISYTSIELNDNLFLPVEEKLASIESISLFIPFDQIENQKSQQLFVINNDLPPPLFGKNFLQSVHQLKLDTPIC